MSQAFAPDVISPKGAVGVMQIMPLTAKSVFNVPRYQLFDPEVNIRLGVQFLDQLIGKYDGKSILPFSLQWRIKGWQLTQSTYYTRNQTLCEKSSYCSKAIASKIIRKYRDAYSATAQRYASVANLR